MKMLDLTHKEAMGVWEHALEEIHSTIRNPNEMDKVYLARCWTEGLLKALKAGGFKVCIEKESRQVSF